MKGRSGFALVVLSALMAVSRLSFAETYTHEEGGIQVDVPDGWYVDDGDEVLSLETPDGSVLILFWVPEEDTWEKAMDGLGAELDQVMEDVRIESEGEEGELNGMAFFEIAGTGSVEGIAVEWSLTLLLAKKPVIALSFAESDGWDANQDAVFKLISSIKKTQ